MLMNVAFLAIFFLSVLASVKGDMHPSGFDDYGHGGDDNYPGDMPFNPCAASEEFAHDAMLENPWNTSEVGMCGETMQVFTMLNITDGVSCDFTLSTGARWGNVAAFVGSHCCMGGSPKCMGDGGSIGEDPFTSMHDDTYMDDINHTDDFTHMDDINHTDDPFTHMDDINHTDDNNHTDDYAHGGDDNYPGDMPFNPCAVSEEFAHDATLENPWNTSEVGVCGEAMAMFTMLNITDGVSCDFILSTGARWGNVAAFVGSHCCMGGHPKCMEDGGSIGEDPFTSMHDDTYMDDRWNYGDDSKHTDDGGRKPLDVCASMDAFMPDANAWGQTCSIMVKLLQDAGLSNDMPCGHNVCDLDGIDICDPDDPGDDMIQTYADVEYSLAAACCDGPGSTPRRCLSHDIPLNHHLDDKNPFFKTARECGFPKKPHRQMHPLDARTILLGASLTNGEPTSVTVDFMMVWDAMIDMGSDNPLLNVRVKSIPIDFDGTSRVKVEKSVQSFTASTLNFVDQAFMENKWGPSLGKITALGNNNDGTSLEGKWVYYGYVNMNFGSADHFNTDMKKLRVELLRQPHGGDEPWLVDHCFKVSSFAHLKKYIRDDARRNGD